MRYPTTTIGAWPQVDEAQMREIDRIAINDFGISLLQMMENAGRSLAQVAMQEFQPRTAVVFAGSGGNGGGGMAAARHLSNRGVDVHVHLASASTQLTRAGAHQRNALISMGIAVHEPTAQLLPADLFIDAMVGYSLHSEPTGEVASVIAWIKASGAPVLSLDVPTGFSAASGTLHPTHVAADVTLTLAAPKRGLFESLAKGALLVADIGIPGQVFALAGLNPPPVGGSWIVAIEEGRTPSPERL
ncbi:MAG: NAD(P)H-hydrate epimerase [Candidatus Nanopelagicales bacterium]